MLRFLSGWQASEGRGFIAGRSANECLLLRVRAALCMGNEQEHKKMDFLRAHFLSLWIALSIVCLFLGAYLTKRRRQQPERAVARTTPTLPGKDARTLVLLSPPPLPQKSFRHSHVCSTCGKSSDDPGECFCGFCGVAFPSSRQQQRETPWPKGSMHVWRRNTPWPADPGQQPIE
jgi:hypothetical protein